MQSAGDTIKDQNLAWRDDLVCDEFKDLSLISATQIKLEGENQLSCLLTPYVCQLPQRSNIHHIHIITYLIFRNKSLSMRQNPLYK